MKRRKFIKTIGAGSFLLASGTGRANKLLPWLTDPELIRLTVLHTNDVHSRIDPFPMDGSPHQGLGGTVRREAIIRKIRSREPNVLLLDAGDIFQGTPYFNVFKGELEFKLMTEMKYDAATLGNHDFDAGMEGLIKQMPHADFPFLICNYDFSDTPLQGQTQPYRIFKKGPLKIGVFGLGIELKGLVLGSLYGNTRYLDPVKAANRTASLLKSEKKCDYVICLSHLGYRFRNATISDVKLAENSSDINLIIGGHTHTFLEQPDLVKNRNGEAVLISQVGWAGIQLGRIDILFERNRKKKCVFCENINIRGGS